MRDRLKEKGFDEEAVEKTVAYLTEAGYLNDEDFVIAYLNNAFTKSKGLRMIRFELSDLGVDRYTMEDGFKRYSDEYGYDFDGGEYERALEFIEKQELDDPVKISRKLSYKGFDYQVINKVIASVRGSGDRD